MDLDQMLDFFFRDPAIEPTFQPGNNLFSNLYLLRRDINTCFASDAIWPGVMAIMSGIDLLAKFFAGADTTAPGDVGNRFRAFAGEYLTNNNAIDNEVLYQLRNSLLHSFGLYTKRRARAAERIGPNGFDRQDYAFRLLGDTRDHAIVTLRMQHPIQTAGAAPNNRILLTEYDVHVHALRTAFDAGIRRYSRHLRTNNDLRTHFATHAPSDLRSFIDMYGVTNITAIAVPTQ